MKKRYLQIGLIVTTMIILCGCRKGEITKQNTEIDMVKNVSLKVWCPQNQVDTGIIGEQQIKFAELHPQWNITWTTEVIGEDKASQEILKDAEEAADVFLFSGDQLTELVNAGVIARLGGETEQMVRETMSSEVVKTASVGEALYAIPFTHNTFYLYYDKTIFSENEIACMESILEKDTGPDVVNFYFESGGGWKLGCFYYGAGLQIFGENGDDPAAGVDWNSEKGIAVTEYLIDLIHHPKCAYEGELSVTEAISQHRLGAWFDGAWNDWIYESILGKNLGRAILPTIVIEGEEVQLKSFYGTKCIGVNASSDSMEAAVAFAAYLGTEENQLLRYERSSQVPTNQHAASREELKSDPLVQVIIDQVEKASVVQPSGLLFSNRYWNYANTIPTEIKSGLLNKGNVQEKMNAFEAAMTGK